MDLQGRAADRLGAAAVEGEGPLNLEHLLEYVAKGLVDKPDAVRVVRSERDGATLLELHVATDDVGKVIGKQGRVARALRALVRASGAKTGERRLLEIVG